MQTPLYAKDEDSSPKKSFNPSLLPENRLNLLPEHLGEIGSAFIQQLSLASLNSRDVQILSAIYSQTVGFDKREDDMNGRRLEQLTGIRPDHANATVRRLEKWNVVIARSGDYGKWLSINFDLSSWGKAPSESQTNDPHCLLSACYQALLADEEQLSLHVVPTSVQQETALKLQIESQADLQVQSEIKQQHSIPSPPVVTYSVELPTELPSDLPTQLPMPNHPLPTPLPNKEVSVPIEKNAKKDAFEIHFPSSLAKQLCQKLRGYLQEIKIPQQAQRLVDYFANCLKNRNIRSPIAYFINLKNRLLNGQLDLPEDQNIVKENKQAQQKRNELHYQYQQAITDYKQLKQQIEAVSKGEDCTFEQALERIGYTPIWKKASEKLENIKQSLQNYYQAEVRVELPT